MIVQAVAALALTVPQWPWLALARCETGVQWNHYTRSYEGAYGFTHAAWARFRTTEMPARADWATPGQQTWVAQRIQHVYGWGAWPSCSRRLGLR